ncbi:MAG: endo-1,4-beta-xylanase [Candidatus Symbiothrix sp.]|jgi:endo-1,4-beta-xylanase|nr:endo-1,4-beta-xylanase [Candidatus Symbiothrix sp.]
MLQMSNMDKPSQAKHNWRVSVIVGVLILISACSELKSSENEVGLKDVLKDKFLIGVALNTAQFSGKDTVAEAVIQKHFNAIVAENCMKSMYMQPEEGRFFFDDVDRFVAFGEKRNLTMTGHCLIWHSQAPAWFFTDANGRDVSREVMIERMKNHITTIVSRYKGRIKGWDVVNEAILDNGSWRNSKFYTIIGEEYIRLAFQFAHEADPKAELYYNDYSMANEGRRDKVIEMVKSLKTNGIRIDGVGMQAHLGMNYPPVDAFEKSLVAFAGLGVKVMITELDLSVLPNPKPNIGADVAFSAEYNKEMNPYLDGLPEEVAVTWEKRYNDFFKLFQKHHDKISRVTLWGISDSNSWLNNWPIAGRTNYPLFFDRNYQAKTIVQTVINEAK